MTFQTDFRPYASEGDSIEARVSVAGWSTGLRLVATIYRDDNNESPEDHSEGFWPSLDPHSAGFIGARSESTLRRHTKRAQAVLDAWRNDEWFYCGIAVQAFFDDIPLTDEFSHAVWGVECNYPTSGKRHPNAYLRELADENAHECAREAIRRLTEIVEAGKESEE